jgi:hypothetical protein
VARVVAVAVARVVAAVVAVQESTETVAVAAPAAVVVVGTEDFSWFRFSLFLFRSLRTELLLFSLFGNLGKDRVAIPYGVSYNGLANW